MSSFLDSIGQSAATAGPTYTNTKEKASMGKEDFLKLLVAQLQNQDPLNPEESTEFTSQLAQFSSLEQLENLNSGMETLVNSTENSDRFTTLNTIGKEVAYQSDSFRFSGDPVTLGYQIDDKASEVTLSLQLNGTTIATLNGDDLEKGNHYLTWNGLTADGEKAPVGEYSIVISAKATEGKNVGVLPLVRSEVTGVDLDGESGSTLITETGEILYKNILGVYEPEKQQPEEDENSGNTLDTVADITQDVNDIIN